MALEQTPPTVIATSDAGDAKLLREYHWLTEGAMLGLLNAEQQTRIRQVQDLLDADDDASPAADAMRQQMRAMRQRLDAIETQIRRLPDA